MAQYNNVSSATTTTLIAKYSSKGGAIKLMSISNNSANTATVSVFLYDGSNSYYICKNVTISTGSTLVLDDPLLLSFDVDIYDLKITNAGTSPDITVIIK